MKAKLIFVTMLICFVAQVSRAQMRWESSHNAQNMLVRHCRYNDVNQNRDYKEARFTEGPTIHMEGENDSSIKMRRLNAGNPYQVMKGLLFFMDLLKFNNVYGMPVLLKKGAMTYDGFSEIRQEYPSN